MDDNKNDFSDVLNALINKLAIFETKFLAALGLIGKADKNNELAAKFQEFRNDYVKIYNNLINYLKQNNENIEKGRNDFNKQIASRIENIKQDLFKEIKPVNQIQKIHLYLPSVITALLAVGILFLMSNKNQYSTSPKSLLRSPFPKRRRLSGAENPLKSYAVNLALPSFW